MPPSHAFSHRIGLTGGIGSGKSTVAVLLSAHGAVIVDTDAIAHQLTASGGGAIKPIRAAFGNSAIGANGALDRPAMRALAFHDTSARQRLEAILHPLIAAQAEREATAAGDAPAVVFDVPLLVETGRWRAKVDRVLVVDCDEPTQIERVVRRSGWTPDAVRAVIALQATREARRAVADAVIDNGADVTPADLACAVDDLWRRWMPSAPH